MLSLGTKIDTPRTQTNLLRLVAFYEFLKGAFVFLIGLCALMLVHKDEWVIAESLLALLHISTDRHWAQLFLDFADRLTDARLFAAARLAFTYSFLRFVEVYGLWKQRTWAEWVAMLSGTLLLPIEIRGLMRGITVVRSVILLGNLAIVFYMLFLLLAQRRRRREAALMQAGNLDGSGK
jgi:uncharacterized membrane protein (DUF2068 family)